VPGQFAVPESSETGTNSVPNSEPMLSYVPVTVLSEAVPSV
jgi:hypothetical protein